MDLFMEWLNLAIRWLHVIVGIAWIGASFYFNWLLLRLTDPIAPNKQVQGELWAIHAGGFFRVQKRHMQPGLLPAPLHWFKWEAYWTWISGFALLVLMYYVQADRYLIDSQVADLAPWQAVLIGLATLFVGTGLYDGLWRSNLRKSPRALSVLCCVLLALVTFLLTQVFSGRGAFIHVGALLGTIMVANVAHIIMPSQRELVRATLAGETPDQELAINAGQRSAHNNYLTLPVVFVMLSAHYPMTYGHPHSWLVLLGLFAASVSIRHFFNVRWARGNANSAWLLVVGAILFVAVTYLATPGVDDSSDAPRFATVQAIVSERCVACHAAKPTLVESAGKGVTLETPAEIVRHANAIYAQVVLSRAMPLGNITHMTDAERSLLGAWYRTGKKVP
jgi:uncharacterized membrane protein